ncbi:MAG: putative acetyltransferase [Actinomycetota bacterium]|nr:putative acetyltransferase [Actinomycetota bacterium]
MSRQDIASVTVRREQVADAHEIRDVVTDAFQRPEVGELVDGLRASAAWGDGLSFVAEHGGQTVGHILYTHAFLDAPARLVDVLVLSPLGVRRAFQGRGIGSLLVRRSLEVVDAHDEPLVFLEGSPDFYPRFGFERGSTYGLTAPSVRIPDAAFKVRRLPTYESWMTGALVYPDPFWRFDCVGLR